VRELENCIARGVAFARNAELAVDDLPETVRSHGTDRPAAVSAKDATEVVTLREFERQYLLRTLTLFGGNKSRAARVLGIDRRTLLRKMEGAESPRTVQLDTPERTHESDKGAGSHSSASSLES
jgi:two-component system response regulator HydG